MIYDLDKVQLTEMFKKYSINIDLRKKKNQWQVRLLSGDAKDFCNIVSACYEGSVWYADNGDVYGYINYRNSMKTIKYDRNIVHTKIVKEKYKGKKYGNKRKKYKKVNCIHRYVTIEKGVKYCQVCKRKKYSSKDVMENHLHKHL